jgi:uncharacterized protein
VTEPLGLFAAFLVGLLGSVHCAGMCSGIAGLLGAGQATERAPRRIANTLGYNSGRIASYALAGLAAGLLGSGAYTLFPVSRVAEVGLILSGGFMIMLGLYLADWWRGLSTLETFGAGLWKRIQPFSRHLLPVRSPGQAIALGMLWGWLPCGLVYATLVWALFAADPVYSALIMVCFGLGTLPMLLALGGIAEQISRARRHPNVRRGAGVLIIAFGVLTFLGIVHPVHPGDHSLPSSCTARDGADSSGL